MLEIMVTVITITRGRARLLRRAISSVAAQTNHEAVEHLVLIDDCKETLAELEASGDRTRLQWAFEARGSQDRSGPARSAVLRNQGVLRAAGEWIAFLDDDNEFESAHLTSLLRCANQSGVRAAHSWLQMFDETGLPYTAPVDPWARTAKQRRQRYEWAVANGIRIPGSNVFRDRLDHSGDQPVRTVDTGEWLLRRDLLLETRIPETYSEVDSANMVTEDDKFMVELVESGERVACSKQPTLRYYLGGYSNAANQATFRDSPDSPS